MHTETEVFVQSDAMTVYKFGSATERWPEILPHYRWVRLLEEQDNRKIVEMAARRDFGIASYPVRWLAEQINDPDEPRIKFRHLGGTTKGMEVEWIFTPVPDGVRVAIRHDLELGWPIIGAFAAERVIGPLFIENIAGKTLARMKELAEREQLVAAGVSS